MGKTNQTVTWTPNANVAPAGRTESDAMTQVAAAYDANCDLAITGNGTGVETGYNVDFYAVYTNSSGVFEATPPLLRMHYLGSITVDVTTFPLRLTGKPFEYMPAEYKIVAISGAATDTVTVDVVMRTDAP